MKNLKRATALVLSAAMIMSTSNFAFADENIEKNQIIKAYDSESTYKNGIISNLGTVKQAVNEKDHARISFVVKNAEGKEEEIILKVSEDTIFIDNETGLPSSIDNLKEGDKIYAYYSEIMTRSLPPQSNASYIITNVAENKSSAHIITVSKVTKKDDGNIQVLSDDGMYLITILKDKPISPFKTKQIVTVDDIKEGSRIAVWFDIMTMSIPAQAASDKTVILPEASKEVIEKAPDKIQINGKMLDMSDKQIFLENGNIMVPLRAVSEELGFTIVWDNETSTASMDNGMVKTSVQIGVDGYYLASSKAIGLTSMFKYGAAPKIVNGNTYVPLKLYELLNQGEISVSNDVITINKSKTEK